jgi:hypothetical protein
MKTIILYILFLFIGLGIHAQTTILEEDFESGIFPPSGWVTYRGIDDNGPQNDWMETTDDQNNTYAFSRFSNFLIGVTEDWLVTPLIDLSSISNSELRFSSKETYGFAYESQYDIRVSTNSQMTHSDFSTIATYNDFNETAFEEFIIDLSAYDGQQIYIAFVHTDEYQDDWHLDDIIISGDSGCNIMATTTTGLTGNQYYGQTFTSECSGFIEYVQINVYPGESGTVTGSTLKINEGNYIDFPDYTQDFSDVLINEGEHLRIYLTSAFPVVAGNQYAFETYVANLGVEVDLTNNYPDGHLLMGHASATTSDLGFEVSITQNTLSFENIDDKLELSVYPNPTSSYISLSNLNSEKKYTIYDVTGKEIDSGLINQYSNIFVHHLEMGIYFLKLENYKTLKFIKK